MHVAQLNVGRLHHPLDSPESSEFDRAIDPINALAEASPGFVWRLVDDDGRSSSHVPIPGIDDPDLIVNMSVWTDVESLRHFVNRSGHAMYLRRRREWFRTDEAVISVCWWIEPGTVPDLGEAYQRLLRLRAEGPSTDAWPLHAPVDPPT